MNVPRKDPLFSRAKAAEYLGLATQTLAAWSHNNRYDLPYIKVGRLVKYEQSALDAFIARHRVGGNTDNGESGN
jgi:excisionase family DNA binding protein